MQGKLISENSLVRAFLSGLLLLLTQAAQLSAVTVNDFQARIYTAQGGSLPYRLFVPKNYSAAQKYPLVVFLHGHGEGGTNNSLQLSKHTSAMVFAEERNQARNPCFEIAPQSSNGIWSEDATLELVRGIVNAVSSEFSGIDVNRIYITGLSTGGYGTWYAPVKFPRVFAASAPISYEPYGISAQSLLNFPIWSFVNSGDVYASGMATFAQNVLALGGEIRSTVYNTSGHNAWNTSYSEPELIPWILQYRLDSTAPSVPSNLTGIALSDKAVKLNWDASTDADSSIIEYRVYRDGVKISTVSGDSYGKEASTSFEDIGVKENTTYKYTVVAVNGGNTPSVQSGITTVQTPADTTPPEILKTLGGLTQVRVYFGEAVDAATAQNASNYSLDRGATVSTATLLADQRSVVLTTSELSIGKTYVLTVRNVRNTATLPSAISSSGATSEFINIPGDGLLLWLNGGTGVRLGNNGKLKGWNDKSLTNANGWQKVDDFRPLPVTIDSKNNVGFSFDGVDDYVALPDGFNDFTQGVSTFVVQNSSGVTASGRIFDIGNGTNADGATQGNDAISLGRSASSSDLRYEVFGENDAGSRLVVSGAIQNNTTQLFSVIQKGGAVGGSSATTIFNDFTALKTGNVQVPRSVTRKQNYIGRWNIKNPLTSGGNFQGVISEVIIYNRSLSVQERLGVQQYLNGKYLSDGVTNRAPVLGAEPVNDLQMISTRPTTSTQLVGAVVDDGLPTGSSLTLAWSKVTGPGTVVFSSPSTRETTATFDAPGDYVLRFSGSDGALVGSVDVAVKVLFVDVVPPKIESVTANGNSRQVTVYFSEPIDKATAETAANYSLDPATAVEGARLLDDQHTVVLSVGYLQNGVSYSLSASGIADLAMPANSGSSTGNFTYSTRFMLEPFSSADLSVWTIVDEGTSDPKSLWAVTGGTLRESSNISDNRDSADDRKGTFAFWNPTGAFDWSDYELKATLRSTDDDGIGVMFYYKDAGNYYRFEMDAQRGFRKLIKKVNGQVELLAQDTTGYVIGQTYALKIKATNGSIEVRLDGAVLFGGAIADSDLKSGTFAFYSWGNTGAYFDDAEVTYLGPTLMAGNLSSLALAGTSIGGTNLGNSMVISNGKIIVSSSALGIISSPTGTGTLNFADGFESYPVGGSITGQNGWTTAGTLTPTVVTGSAIEGTKALSLKGGSQPASATNQQSSSDSVIWSDIKVKPILYSLKSLPAVDATTAAGFCFAEAGAMYLYDGKAGWIKSKVVSLINPTDWQRVTTSLDYGTQTWSIWLNGDRLASGLAFANPRTSFQKLQVSNVSSNPTLLDDVHLTGSQPLSLNVVDSSYFEQKAVSGDFDVQIKMPNISGGNSATIGGLMAREGTGTGSDVRFVSLGATLDGIIKLQSRVSGTQSTQSTIGSLTFPNVWLRLRRVGNTFTTFISSDGTNWTDAGRLTMTDASQAWTVGLFLNSGIAGNQVQATFEDAGSLANPSTLTKGQYFYKQQYTDTPLPDFTATRGSIPTPVLEGNPEWVSLYWNTWSLAYQHYRKPSSGSALVSNYMDEAFDTNTLYQWDTIFMTFFGRYNHANFSAIESLDNFYHAQRANGFIARSFDEFSGTSAVEGADSINPPLFAWAEWENYRMTGNITRLSQVTLALEKYGEWMEVNRVKPGTAHGLFFTTPLASGMDNTPRSGSGWIDMSCQMALHYHYLSRIFDAIGQSSKATLYAQKASDLAEKVNLWMWDDIDEQYYDVTDVGSVSIRKTIASFWPLLTKKTNRDRVVKMVAHLRDASTFGRLTPFPSLSADDPLYNPLGDYWRGGVWAPATYAVIKGLEESGFSAMAKESAEKYLTALEAVYQSTGTLWENNAPDSFAKGNRAFSDFVGWTGLGPIALLIENVIGLEPDAASNTLIWNLRRMDRHGIQHYRLGSNDISVVAEPRANEESPVSIAVQASEPFTLRVKTATREIAFHLAAGSRTISTAEGILQAPVNLMAVRTSAKVVSLSWGDANTAESGYRVYRKAASDPDWDETAWQPVGETTANTATFVDNLPDKQGGGYRYVVRAFNGDELSPASAEATVATLAPVASFSVTGAAFNVNESIGFDASASSDPGGALVAWSWNFGDGQASSAGTSVTHAYSNSGVYRVKLTVTSSSGVQNETSKVVAISDGANLKHALYVTGAIDLNSAEKELKFQLESRGFEVAIKTGSSVASGDASGKDLVVISSSVASTDVNTKFRAAKVPVLVYENQLFDDMGMTDVASTEFGNVSNQTKVDIIDNGSPLAAGLPTGATAVYIQPSFVSWGKPGANAIKVASVTGNSSQIALFGYDVGVTMVGLVAPERRVGLFLENEGGGLLTQAGLDLFNASVNWLVNQKPSVQLTAPSPGANVLFGESVTLSATATDGDGTVSKVEFFDGAQSLGVATVAPYTVTTNSLAQGGHVLTAVATDNRGGARTSAAISITVLQGTVRDLWKKNYFTTEELANLEISGDLADPDGDGMGNVLEFALGGNPRGWSTGAVPSVLRTSVAGKDYLTLTYTRPKNAADISYRPEVSGDLSVWCAGPTATVEIGRVDNGTTETVSVRDLIDTGAATQRFVRLTVASSTSPQVSYTQNFDSLPNSSGGSDIVWTNNSTLPAWYANRNQLRVSDGSGGSLDSAGYARLISFGTTGNADRALGSSHHIFASDNTLFGVRFVNNTGKTLDHFTVTFDGEQWRRANVTNPSNQALNFQYAINPASLSSGAYVSVTGLSFESIDDGGNASGGAGLNGNTISLRRISATVTRINWAPGASLWLRWSDIDDAGVNDHGLGIDNFEFSTDFNGKAAVSDSQGVLTLPE